MDVSAIHILAALRAETIGRFRDNLSREPTFKLTFVTSEDEARAQVVSKETHQDVLVIDNNLGGVFEFVRELRRDSPRLWIVLVDEEADFGMPGLADEVSTEPFKDDDLTRKIKRLAEERRLETLSSNTLAPVKLFAQKLNKAGKGVSKLQAAVETVKELGYDFVAYYSVSPTSPPALTLSGQVGPENIKGLMQSRVDYSGLLGWVAQNGTSRIVGPGEEPTHPLLQKGKFGCAACVPVGSTLRFGVIFACRAEPASIQQEHVLMLELVSRQLASALAKEARN